MSDHSHENHGSYKSYMTGFLLSVVLTVIPFGMVLMGFTENKALLFTVIFGLGAIQMLVHIHYFLHVSVGAEEGWQMMSTLLTLILLSIVFSGSIWVMTHLHENMMPSHDIIERVRQLP